MKDQRSTSPIRTLSGPNYKLSSVDGALQVSIAALYREHTGKELKANDGARKTTDDYKRNRVTVGDELLNTQIRN